MKRKLVWVSWQDCSFLGTAWQKADELPKANAFLLESAGLLVKETKRGLYLATDYSVENGEYRYLCFVPKKMIKRMEVVTIK